MQELGSGQNPGPGHENCAETAEMMMAMMRMRIATMMMRRRIRMMMMAMMRMPSIMMMITWRTLD